MVLRLFVAGLGLLAPALSLAQAYCDPRADAACYQRWCTSQGGKPVYRGNWGCDMSGARSGYSGGGGGGAGAELGRQIGGVLGALIREGLFGNPQQDALRQAEMEAQRNFQEQERQRIAAEQVRQDDARYQRLRTSLLDFSPGPQLSLMGTQRGGSGLQLLLGEDAERSTNPALAELARAAAWSTLAARASSPEDAVVLADAAFQSLIGGKVDLPPPPPDVKGVPVHPLLPEVEPLKKQYLELRTQLPNAIGPVVDAEQRRATFLRLERESLEMERTAKEAAKRAQARDAARQARELREKAEAELRSARADFQRQQYKANDVEQGLRALLSSMALPPRKPNSYFYLGFEDASQCFSQNSGPRCDKARAPAAEFDQCLANYRQGYTAGEKVRKEMLDRAFQWGGRDGLAGIYAINDAKAEGPCRYDYVVSYNRGYFDTTVSGGSIAQVPARIDVPAPASSSSANQSPARAPDSSLVGKPNTALPKSVDEAIPRTAAGERVRKGFQAIQLGDWKVAHAWFQDALKREPGNPGIRRLVDLTEFTRDFRDRGNMHDVGTTPKPSTQLPTQSDTINPAKNPASDMAGPGAQPDNVVVRAAASQMAAASRANAAYRRYKEKYGDRDPAGAAGAASKAAQGEGYTDKELKAQLGKALLEARKLYEKNHPDGPGPSSVSPASLEEIVIGGKG